MIDKLVEEELGAFTFPKLYVDQVSKELPFSFRIPQFFGKNDRERFEKGGTRDERPFWKEVLEQNARLGAGYLSLENAAALSRGGAIPIVAGQQPGLLGGPLYTLYKVLTAASLAEHLSLNREPGEGIGSREVPSAETVRAVPVLWNASDDSDFVEVSSATFFARDLSLRKLSAALSFHAQGNMVGSTSNEAVNGPIETLMQDVDSSPAASFVMSCIEDGLSVARDWGELFSALFLKLLPSSGLVVVDARLPSVAEHSRPVIEAYLNEADPIDTRVAARLEELVREGYPEPISHRSGDTCVFLRDGATRRKITKEELPEMADLWKKRKVEILPNVLLGPIVRDYVMEPAADVLGPSETSYYVVVAALADVLGLAQRPIFPRLSLTIVPSAVAALLGVESAGFKDLVLSYDKLAQSYFEKLVPEDVTRDLESLENEVRSASRRMLELAAASGRGAGDVASSAARKIDFELGRVREGFVAAFRRKAMSENPMLRKAGEFLLPSGNFQERSLCSLAPLIYGGEPLLRALGEVAGKHVLECLEHRVHHYIASAEIP